MKLHRLIYLVYYIKELRLKQFRKFLHYANTITGKSSIGLIIDTIISVFKYNISITDYFHFRFFESDTKERNKWAGTGFMYEFQLKMNPKSSRKVLENKIEFNKKFKFFVKREFVTLDALIKDPGSKDQLLNNITGKLVIKNSTGQAGREIRIIQSDDLTHESLIKTMMSGRYDLAEEYIVQHPSMDKLSPSGINTVRIITMVTNHATDILGARLRISINSHVDNMAAGNAAAPIDPFTGIVTGNAVFSDITKPEIRFHPVTDMEIPGFQIPYWPEVIEMVMKASLIAENNRSVGWDIAITPTGPLLIEGNHNWCKLLWQLPVKKGLKMELERYL